MKPIFRESNALIVVCAALLTPCTSSSTNPSPVPPKSTMTFAYVTNIVSKTLSAYAVNATSGALTPVTGSPFPTRANPWGVAVVRTGKFVYVQTGSGPISTAGAAAPLLRIEST